MIVPSNLKYTQNDEWIRIDGQTGTVGITDYAQEQLSDIVFVEVVANEGETLNQGDACATVESVKAAADIYLPVSGKILAINEALAEKPETLNSDPYGEAWLLKIEITNPAEVDGLLDASAYEALIASKE
jgi:glycine cleavage system H protein